MRFQPFVRLIAIGLIVAAGLIWLSINLTARSAQAQAATATPRSASAPITEVPLTYTVKSGDSFNAIARQFNLTPQQLQTLNAISNTNLIYVGQVLIVAVSPFTPTQASAPPLTAISTETPLPLPTETPTVKPTSTPTHKPVLTDQPTTMPAPTQTSAPPSTAISTETPLPLPTETPTVKPTTTPTHKPVLTDQPVTMPAPKSIASPAPKSPVGIPLDVILAVVVMFVAVLGLIIGFRTQRG